MNYSNSIKAKIYILPLAVLVFSLFGKLYALFNIERMTAMPEDMKSKLPYIIALEAACLAVYIPQRTRNYGFYLLCSYLGGAIATHFMKGEAVYFPLLVLVLLWVAHLTHKKDS